MESLKSNGDVQREVPVEVLVVGAGERGKVYGGFTLDNPDRCKVIGVAEPSERRRAQFVEKHKEIKHVFRDWRELIGQPKLADAAIICLQDRDHAECVVALAGLGYHIMCEKPMAITPQDCAAITRAVLDANVIFAVGHVLRYSPYNVTVKALLNSGLIGDLINVVHVEPVGWWHYAHSYVRGNWSREEQSTFSLMAKSCHDLDILCHYFGSAHPPRRVHSFGSLTHFRKDQKPVEAGSATRCVDCAYEPQCPYSAPRLYLDKVRRDERGWPASVVVGGLVPEIESVHEAMRNGPYGKCVYEAPNDVCDNQVVNVEFAGGRTASFTMVAFSELICERQTRFHGTRGELVGDSHTIQHFDFTTGQKRVINPGDEIEGVHGSSGGHGGGDYGLMTKFLAAIKANDQTLLGCTPQEALQSHILVFAAEHARKSSQVVDLKDFVEKIDNQTA
ncbi:hypothetical protein HDV00_010220 [Rhizophlyctis rosea]|nr:hypothetical protein HDV00_010220 [Rhizophlyctis rosea]